MKLTRAMILIGRTDKGGWTRKQLYLIGVSWPPKKGWLDSLLATNPQINEATFHEFLHARLETSRR